MEHKLLHLAATNDESTTDYECVFNEDILVKKNSQIALQSISMNFNPNQLYIDNTNNSFYLYQGGSVGFGALDGAGNATSIQNFLANGVYNQNSLLQELQKKLNNAGTRLAVDATPLSAKYEYKTNINTSNKVEIQFAAAGNNTSGADATQWIVNNPANIRVSGDPASFTKLAGGGTNDYVMYKPIFIRSRGQIKGKITAAHNGIVFGLAELVDPTQKPTMNATDYVFAIYTDNNLYNVVLGPSNITISTVIPANGDLLMISLANGVLTANVSKDSGATYTELGSLDVSSSYNNLYHFCITLNNAASVVDTWQITPSPFQLSSSDGVHLVDNISELNRANYIDNIGVGAPPSGAPPTLTMTFSDGLREILGFSQNTQSARTFLGTYTGTSVLETISFPNALYVELLNVSLESYDSVTRRRKNVIAYLNGLERTAETNSYYYDAKELVYIKTHLLADTLINSWQIRITDGSSKAIVVDPGKVSINLVIRQQ